MNFSENEYVKVFIKRSSGEGEAYFPALITHSIIEAGKMLIPVHIRKLLDLRHGEYLEVKIRRFSLDFEAPET